MVNRGARGWLGGGRGAPPGWSVLGRRPARRPVRL